MSLPAVLSAVRTAASVAADGAALAASNATCSALASACRRATCTWYCAFAASTTRWVSVFTDSRASCSAGSPSVEGCTFLRASTDDFSEVTAAHRAALEPLVSAAADDSEAEEEGADEPGAVVSLVEEHAATAAARRTANAPARMRLMPSRCRSPGLCESSTRD